MKRWCGTHVGRARRHWRGFRAPARADQRSAVPCQRAMRHGDCLPSGCDAGFGFAGSRPALAVHYGSGAGNAARPRSHARRPRQGLAGLPDRLGTLEERHLDLASEGYARFTFVPLLAVEPGLPVNARFSGRIFAASGQRAVPRSSRPDPRPIRTARAPRDRTSDRGRPRPPRGLAPLGQPPRFAPPRPRKTGRTPARGPRGLGAPAPRGGSRGGAAGASPGRAPTGRAKPRGGASNPRGGTSGPRRGAASGMRNGGAQKPRQHR